MTKKSIRPEGSSPLRPAAKAIISQRLHSAIRLVKDISVGCARKPEYIHQLRVAVRRAEAAISAFEPELRPKAVARARKRLRTIRKAAGAARDCDVHRVLLGKVEGLDSPDLKPVLRYLTRRLNAARQEAAREVIEVARRKRARKLKEARKDILELPRRTDDPTSTPSTLLGAALRDFATATAATRTAAAADLSSLDSLHALRVSAKQVRYAVEIFRACLPDALCDSTLTNLREFQAALGRINDARQMGAWLADEARDLADAARPMFIPRGTTPESIHEELRVMHGRLEADLAAAHAAALPKIPALLDAALRPLETWTHSAGTGFQPAALDSKGPAGRSAQGPTDRREHAASPRRVAST